jgi:23S rRNA pseudouridine2605 synthase
MFRKTPKWLAAARTQDASKPADFVSRALGRAGILPSRRAEEAVAAGRVTLNHRVVREAFSPVQMGDVVTVDGQRVSLQWQTQVLMFHKTKGLVTAQNDPENIGTVFESLKRLLPPALRSFEWHAVGRLDRDTTGLLLFTNDEKCVAHATKPQTHLPKRYVAQVSGVVTAEKLKRLESGVSIEHDVVSKPARAKQRGEFEIELTLTEGKFHQVKRMLQAVKLNTLILHREAIGTLELDIELGAFRPLTRAEITENLGFLEATLD